jgi:hypothetical protein
MKDKNFGRGLLKPLGPGFKLFVSIVNSTAKLKKQYDCLHTNTELEEDLGNGYFRVECMDCGFRFTDG